MIDVDIPGRGRLRLLHLALDLNGTLTDRGVLLPGVAERLTRVHLETHLLSADTFGALAGVAEQFGVRAQTVADGAEKARFLAGLGVESCAAIGNGANDAPMLEAAALGIAVLGPEGTAAAAVRAADVVARSIVEALDLLLDERALVATLRL